MYARVCEALGISEDTLKVWRDADPSFQAELDEAGRQCDRRIGQLARKALEVDLAAYLAGEPLLEEVMNAKGIVKALKKPRPLNVGMVRTALTKLDPSWTHPVQQVDVTVTTVGEALDAIDVTPERVATHPPTLPAPEADA